MREKARESERERARALDLAAYCSQNRTFKSPVRYRSTRFRRIDNVRWQAAIEKTRHMTGRTRI